MEDFTTGGTAVIEGSTTSGAASIGMAGGAAGEEGAGCSLPA